MTYKPSDMAGSKFRDIHLNMHVEVIGPIDDGPPEWVHELIHPDIEVIGPDADFNSHMKERLRQEVTKTMKRVIKEMKGEANGTK